MFHHRKRSEKVFSVTPRGRYEESCYTCKDCNISCTSAKQLQQHLNGVKHQEKVKNCQQKNKAGPEERSGSSSRTVSITHAEENMFPMEHMFILDETEEDMTNECAPSCDSSDSEADTASAGFQTFDISKKHLVVLDETNEDEHPASPASCNSPLEVAPSSPATVKSIDEQPKKARLKMADHNRNAPSSPLSDVSIYSSNSAPEAENVNEESEDLFGQELHCTKHCDVNVHKKQKDWKEIPVLKPVTCNQDVFHFLKNFEVANKSDVTFALRIAQMFSKALNKYREDKLEEMLCTEEEEEQHHVSPNATLACSPSAHEYDNTSSNEQMHSFISQANYNREFRRSRSRSLSPWQSISHASSSTCSSSKTLSSFSSHPNVIPSSSLKDATEVVNSPKSASITESTADGIHKSETDLWMEGDYCLTAEAACSDDEDT